MDKKLLKDYIENIKETNARQQISETRPGAIYVPGLDNMVLIKNVVNPKKDVSTTSLLYLEKKDSILGVKLHLMTPEQRKEFFLNNLDQFYVHDGVTLGYMMSYLESEIWGLPIAGVNNKLSMLKVHRYFRSLGLGKELITILKNQTAVNGARSIQAKISALDTICADDKKSIDFAKELMQIQKGIIEGKPADIHTLAQIYKSYGFDIPEDYINNPHIKMDSSKIIIPTSDKYPAEFTEYGYHKKTDIFVK